MRLIEIFLVLGFGVYHVGAFAVFAHFMVGNTRNYNAGDWRNDMNAAKEAGIDAFALNMAKDEKTNSNLDQAFEVAASLKFGLFFSFDYAGNGYWDKNTVIDLINKWKGNSAYYKRGSQPLASTFEGSGAATEWIEIKSKTGCFFVPDYSSLGAKDASSVGSGVADGLFSWAAWPAGPTDMNTYGDASYMQFIAQAGRSTYMMPVSPWFYTNLPGFEKNWLWRGDDLWYDRWIQVLYLARIQKDFTPPEFAQIISWNDFGESHYIGPIITKATYALDKDTGNAPFNYANGVGHGGFRKFLPFLIQLAKTGTATVGTQGVRMWYRNSAMSACGFSGTVGNTATQLQLEYSPAAIMQDKIFYSALLGAAATVTVTVGGVSLGATWTDVPATGVGIYHGSASFAGKTGQVVVTVNGIASVVGDVPIGGCSQQNFNPFSYGADGPASSASVNMNSHVCMEGFGIGEFQAICKFSCGLGYCPVTACTCSKIGPQPKRPTALQKDGFPADGNRNFDGLCSFAVNYGYTGKECSTNKPATTFIPTKSPFFPNTTTSGNGLLPQHDLMCTFSCRYGWCPMHLCRTNTIGELIPVPAIAPVIGTLRTTLSLDERLLCRFTSIFGKANKDLCFEPPPPTTTGGAGGGGNSARDVYIDPTIWKQQNPHITCSAPCTFILPPTVLPSPTTISLSPYTTDLEIVWTINGQTSRSFQTTTITLPPVTTQTISFYEYTFSGDSGFTFSPIPRIKPSLTTVKNDKNPEVTRTITPSPYPTKKPQNNDDDRRYGGPYPPITVDSGAPGPICVGGCGTRCLIGCGGGGTPCIPLLNCPRGTDFQDPLDPVKDNDDDDDDDDDDEPPLTCPFGPLDDRPTVRPVDLGPNDQVDLRYGEYPGADDNDQTNNPGIPPSTPTTTAPNPPPTSVPPTQRLWVYYVNYIDEIDNNFQWKFFNIPYTTTSWSVCTTENALICPDNGDKCRLATGEKLDDPPWPKGTYTMTRGSADDCVYSSDGNGPGSLKCPNKDSVACKDAGPDKVTECGLIAFAENYYAAVTCDW